MNFFFFVLAGAVVARASLIIERAKKVKLLLELKLISVLRNAIKKAATFIDITLKIHFFFHFN
jgi:hypothetical protein